MNFRKITTFLSLSLLSTMGFSQQYGLTGCSVGTQEGAMIKERMLENRRLIPAEQIDAFRSSRAVTYVPVKFTIVGNSSSQGYVDIDNVFAMLCDMNDDYRTQNVQFYMKDLTNTIRYANNQNVYNDGAGFSSQSYMVQNKSSNAVNIYMSASVNNQVASYYSPVGDFIFVLNQMTNGSSSTGSHETGHFLSLPHTFLGWEGTTFNNGTAPNSVGGDPVEKVARTGTGSNCASAADGFCDTPADYLSYRAFCPYNGGGLDPTGVAINPEESLIMSYFADQCVDSFTADQKNAMAADLLSRGWSNLAAPTPNATVTGMGMTASNPLTGTSNPLNGDITLTWNAVPNATAYVVLLERTLLGSPIETIRKTIVYGTNSLTVPASALAYPRQYTWKVKPFNQYSACGPYSSPFTFTTTAPVSSNNDIFKENAELKIVSNPVSTSSAEILVNVPAATSGSLLLYSMDGKQIINENGIEFNSGDNVQLLDVSTLGDGTYILVITTPEGSLQQKMVISK